MCLANSRPSHVSAYITENLVRAPHVPHNHAHGIISAFYMQLDALLHLVLISSSKRLRLHPYHDTIMAISCIAVYKGHQRGWNIVKICCFLIIVFYYSFEGRGNLLNVNLVREINDTFSYFISRK